MRGKDYFYNTAAALTYAIIVYAGSALLDEKFVSAGAAGPAGAAGTASAGRIGILLPVAGKSTDENSPNENSPDGPLFAVIPARGMAASDNMLDFSRHPFYDRFKGLLPFIMKAKKEASSIYSISALDMVIISGIESNYGQNTLSRTGALGIWQLMPDAAREEGLYVRENENYDRAEQHRQARRALGIRLDSIDARVQDMLSHFPRVRGRAFGRKDAYLIFTGTPYADSLDELAASRIPIADSYYGEREQERRFNRAYVNDLRRMLRLPHKRQVARDQRTDIRLSTMAAGRIYAKNMRAARGNRRVALSMYNVDGKQAKIMPAAWPFIKKFERQFASIRPLLLKKSYARKTNMGGQSK
jgi:hypothetical protein